MRSTVNAGLALSLALSVTLAGCATDPDPHPLAPRPVETVERWRVEHDGTLLGTVERIRILDPAGPVERFEVLTAAGQRAGFIDPMGRVYQRQPFVEGERFLGVHPMEKGVAMLYEVAAPVRIVPVDSAATPASADR